MEQPAPYTHEYVNMAHQPKKISNTISWLGFSFSLFVLLMLCVTVITIAKSVGNHNGIFDGSTALMMLVLLIGTPIGLAGMILSIVGLIKASNKDGKKWIGVCGLIFTGLSILSVFAPVVIATTAKTETIEVKVPEGEDTARQDKGILLKVDGYQLKCYDNKNQIDTAPYVTHLKYISQIKRELEVWFTIHNVEKNDVITLKVSQDTDYSQIADLIDALNQLGMKKFQLISERGLSKGSFSDELQRQ